MAENNSTNNTIDEVVKDTSPQLGGNLDTNGFNIDFDNNKGIRDSTGNEILFFGETASAINYVKLDNTAAGANPVFTAVGDDSVIGINFATKGTNSGVGVRNTTGTLVGRFHLYEASNNGDNYVSHSAIDSLSNNYNVRWGSNMSVTFQNFTASAYVKLEGGIVSASAAVSSTSSVANAPLFGWTNQYYHNGANSLWFTFNTLVVTPFIGKRLDTSNDLFITDRFFFNAGTAGTGDATGFSVSNDVVYCFPIFLPPGQYDNFAIGIETADAGGTADLDVAIFSLTASNQHPTATNTLVGQRTINCGTISNISTPGQKTLSFTSTFLGGWTWIAIRSDNINTSLSLGVSPNLSQKNDIFSLNGAVNSDGASVASESPAYGVYYTGMTSMPVNLSDNSFSGIINAGVGLALQAT